MNRNQPDEPRQEYTDSSERQGGQGARVGVKRWLVIVGAAIVVVAIALAVLLPRGSGGGAGRPVPAPSGDVVPAPSGATSSTAPRPGEVVITLPPERLANAHIKTELVTEPVEGSTSGPVIRTTGTVQSNAYKEVPVLPVAGGIVKSVSAELGDQVKRGQPLATIFSTELADAQSAYLKMLAEVDRHHKHLKRTQELVEIGAASRQELEEATAVYQTEHANLASAKQRLVLLGMTPAQVDALRTTDQVNPIITVEAPSSGTIISRMVNTGEVVMGGKELFRVADLATVWVMGQVYERDFAALRVGAPITVTAPAYPDRTFRGRVTYIDPRVDPETRTAQIRVEVNNPGQMLKLGMFVDVILGEAGKSPIGKPVAAVPRGAVQFLGGRQVLYLATDKPGVFVQREVVSGSETNGLVAIFSGVNPGERVVTEGSFLLRAESLKIKPDQLSATSSQSVIQSAPATEPARIASGVQVAKVRVTENGYEPVTVTLRKGVPARLTFVREVGETCGTEVVIAEFNIKQNLPLNEPVVVEFTPSKVGQFEFTCGMKMLKGKIIVR